MWKNTSKMCILQERLKIEEEYSEYKLFLELSTVHILRK